MEEVLENQNKLPKGAELKLIQGGNHSQFGYFGKLLFDEDATISREEQHLKTKQYLKDFIEKIVQDN